MDVFIIRISMKNEENRSAGDSSGLRDEGCRYSKDGYREETRSSAGFVSFYALGREGLETYVSFSGRRKYRELPSPKTRL